MKIHKTGQRVFPPPPKKKKTKNNKTKKKKTKRENLDKIIHQVIILQLLENSMEGACQMFWEIIQYFPTQMVTGTLPLRFIVLTINYDKKNVFVS